MVPGSAGGGVGTGVAVGRGVRVGVGISVIRVGVAVLSEALFRDKPKNSICTLRFVSLTGC